MRTFLFSLLIASACLSQYVPVPFNKGASGGGAISLVHANVCAGNPQPSGTACSITSTTSGNSLVVSINLINAANTVSTVTDSSGDTFTHVTTGSCPGAGTSGAGANDFWWIAAATAGTTTVSVTTGAAGTYFTAYEVNKLTGLDATCLTTNAQGPSTTPTSPSLTNISPISFIVAVMAPTGNCTGITGAFTNDTTLGGYCEAHLITSSAGANQATWTASSSTYGSSIVSFKN